MNTSEMTRAAVLKLAEPGERHRLEWGVSRHEARADIAFSSPTSLHLVEVKGPTDRLTRMKPHGYSIGQMAAYGRIASRCTLVCCPRLVDAAMLLLPEWWGVEMSHRSGLEFIRAAAENPTVDRLELARALHVVELRKLLRGTPRLGKMRHRDLVDVLLNLYPTSAHLQRFVYPVIFNRPVDVGGFCEPALEPLSIEQLALGGVA